MVIDGALCTEAWDTSGESIDLKGADFSDVDAGTCMLNWEHLGENTPNHAHSANDIVGRVLYVKKIYKESDCETARQKFFWDKFQLPFAYGVCRLFDGAGHDGARAIAAIIRDQHANGELLCCRFSVEGSTLDRKDGKLTETVVRRVAVTVKPANRSANSGLLVDPNAPDGYDKSPERKDILEDLTRHEHPMYAKLGGWTECEIQPLQRAEADEQLKAYVKAKVLLKALEAGVPSAAPSSLVGGAALQREDPTMSLMCSARAALRDYGHRVFASNRRDFLEFAKHRMPDADPAFLERFADMVDETRARLSKKVAEEPDESEVPDHLTVQGSPVHPSGAGKVRFDSKSGVLTTPRGRLRMYIPQGKELDEFMDLISAPHIEKHHAVALAGWRKANEAVRKGQVPPEVVMHGALFAMFSPNTSVPMQELMYSHMNDSMRHVGRTPLEEGAITSGQKSGSRWVVKPGGELGEDFMSRNLPRTPPEHDRDYFETHGGVKIKSKKTATGRVRGDFRPFELPYDKLARMSRYHAIHDGLVDLLAKHGEDTHGALAELMGSKAQAALWESRREARLGRGAPDIGEFPGLDVPGMKTKVAAYMLGMLGHGRSMVPDTHFIRHLFGLHKNKDAATVGYLKDLLWEPRNVRVLREMDRYYAAHHPAVAYLASHPEHGRHFKSKEDAVFPAFWRHWMVIYPHEKRLGREGRGKPQNELTTHQPYWTATTPLLGKHEHRYELPRETVDQHLRWVDRHGDMHALLMYFEQLHPRLVRAHEDGLCSPVLKMEELAVDLKKAAAGALPEHRLVDAEKHGVHSHSPEQKALLHGFDVDQSEYDEATYAGPGGTRGDFRWRRAADGSYVFLKADPYGGLGNNEITYHNMARDFFGLGEHVPLTAAFRFHDNPDSSTWSIQRAVLGGQHNSPHDKTHYQEMLDSGRLHQLFLMNRVMGQEDRHGANFIWTKERPYLHLIDNEYILPGRRDPRFLPQYVKEPYAVLHPVAARWLRSLDPSHLERELTRHDVRPNSIEMAVDRLNRFKDLATNLNVTLNEFE